MFTRLKLNREGKRKMFFFLIKACISFVVKIKLQLFDFCVVDCTAKGERILLLNNGEAKSEVSSE